MGDEKEPRFDFPIPYGSYIQEQTRKYKKDIKNAKNWTYHEQEDCFICPNGRKVTFKRISLVIVAGIRQLLSEKNPNNTKASGEKRIVFLHLLHFRDFLDNPFFIC
ncbi:hypothetical protein [Peribacillus tepidiphilus]|uniref:hypothetical protein n=1 Tax=Peribacillus tepidiphilus TaxID=2652445 RepID=UPI001290F3B5|nr:hypothetical protein [Peribacillus tepidiphilus]